MKLYDHKHNDLKWQKKWEEEKLYKTPRIPGDKKDEKKVYVLDMFPYPSGEGLHVGHPKGYIATDIYSRFKRMNGYDVLHPMGWDAYGLPAEQYALKNKVHPRVAVERNIANFKQQLSHLGLDYDWEREINTTDPSFYKWTQWIFTKMYEKGLAYESNEPINWCPSCKTGLANEDLNGDLCERCDSVVEKKPLRQWVLKITDYADRLIKDLDDLNWPEGIKTAQKNWIGRSGGAEFDFKLAGVKDHADGQMSVKVFTTRADTLFGVTFVAISAEMAKTWLDAGWQTDASVAPYVISTLEEQKKENDYSVIPEKTGVFSGVYAVNPATQEKVPVWIANYVMGGVGTGAVMGVPAHDERDYEFAKKYSLLIQQVIVVLGGGSISADWNEKEQGYVPQNFNDFWNDKNSEEGILINSSDNFNGMKSEEAKTKIIETFGGKKVVKYKLQDWVFARQRYWGEPFPVVRDVSGKVYMVDESDLPVLLPEVEKYEPTGTGESPLADIVDWVNVNGYITDKGTFKSLPTLSAFSFDTTQPLDINVGPGSDAYVSSAPIVERNNIACIIKHPTEDKYLISKWKQVKWSGFLTGGIEEGSTKEDTAKQEIVEETGYTNIKKVTIHDFASHGLFYHVVKKQNRLAHYNLIVVELEDLTQEKVSEEEQAIAEYVWVPKHEVGASLTRYDMKSLWQYYSEGMVTVTSPLTSNMYTRETNTMPQWAGSSWYYLRFADPHNDTALIDPVIEKSWLPVDVYVGGDHATRHLIYARFWHKFLHDIGVVSTIEPFKRLEFLGFILAEDGRKMSKRWGNVINPDEVVSEYGADTLRVYEMFMAPFEQTASWSTSSIKGSDKFLDRVYSLKNKIGDISSIETELHKTIKKVTEDIENFKFNTAISSMMILVNSMESGTFTKQEYASLLQILAPFAPHLTEQVWSELGNETSVHLSHWPEYNENKLIDGYVTIALQIGGKMRGTIEIGRDSDDSVVMDIVKSHEMYQKYVRNNKPKKVIIIKNKVVNILI